MNRRRMGAGVLTTTLVAALVVACGSEKKTVPGDNSKGTYTITFPSAAAAVATDTMQVIVFDASQDASSLCFSLVQKRKSHQDLPPAIVTGDPVALCDLFKTEQDPNNPALTAGKLDVGYGEFAFLAVGQRQGSDFMIGCSLGNVTADSGSVAISVAAANLTTNPVPALPSTCDPNTPLTQHCDTANASKCSP